MKRRRIPEIQPDVFTLYPTTFRWNKWLSANWLPWYIFISHYVQMKLFMRIKLVMVSLLYIPLRSDETWPGRWCRTGSTILYIPLRSDETWRNQHSGKSFRTLYIPLRSDETAYLFDHYEDWYRALYPTTFRWNFGRTTWGRIPDHQLYIPLRSDETCIPLDMFAVCMPFISHYVQMKPT